MDRYARLSRAEPYANDEPLRFVPLTDLEPVEVALTPAAIPLGGSILPAGPAAQYRGGSIPTDDDLEAAREMIAGINRDIRFVELKVKRQTPGASRTRNIVSRQPRTRGRESHRGRPGHRRTTSTRAGPSDDSDGDGPGEAGPPARRRVVVDERYVVVAVLA